MGSDIEELEGATILERIRNAGRPVVVEFYTRTCPNCRAVEPVFREMARELSSEADFARIDTERHTSAAFNFGVMGVPTFMTFCSGQPVGAVVGALNPTLLRNDIRDAIGRSAECASRTTRINYDFDGYA
ncbi:MAG: thioredoxin family protein [Thermoplasmata archaeon]|nr:thioredoxin family protein [Thermoplasmata archaeon]